MNIDDFPAETPEEKALRLRRLEELLAGRNPDSGEPLRPGDEVAFQPSERNILKRQREFERLLESQRDFERERLAYIESDFANEHNPVYIFEAIDLCERLDSLLPEWVLNFLRVAARKIIDIGDAPAGREADIIGRALGFGATGRGQRGRITRATIERRNWDIYYRVKDRLREGVRPTNAYSQVAREVAVSPETVRSAFCKINKSDKAK